MIERLFERVLKSDGCWLWTGSMNASGYGRIKIAGKYIRAHRASWTIHFGAIPDGMMVCHHCDNSQCVKPGHLFIGSARDNKLDCVRKGRAAHNGGTAHGAAKLTVSDVIQIRELAATKMRKTEIADRFGISAQNVNNIYRRYSWRSVV